MAEEVTDAAVDAAEVGRGIAESTPDIDVAGTASRAGEVAGQASDAAADGAQAAYGAASDFINNPETQAIIGEGFGELDKAYSMSVTEAKEGMMIASGLASAGCLAIIPLLRIEIFRDFSQLMGVVFGSAYSGAEGLMYATVSAFGGAFNIFTLNLGTAFQTETAATIGFIIVFVLGILSILLYVWLVSFSGVANMAEDEVRMGNEAEDFVDIAKRKKKTVFVATQTITLSVSAYLPVCQSVAQVMFCDKESYLIRQNGGSCNNDWYTFLVGMAVILIILFIIPLPIFLYTMIERFKPKGSPKNPEIVYDQDGEEVPFDDKVYNELVEHDINQQMIPFRSLYQGFEKDNSQWKVYLMIYKVLFVLPTIILSAYASNVAVAAFQLVLICLNLIASTAASPYIDPMNDQMDFDGRLCAVVVGIGGIITAAFGSSTGAATGMGAIVLVANCINGLSMILIMCAGIPFVSRTVKNCNARFTWSDTSRGLENLPAKKAIEYYDVKKEVKHRVWQTWWNGVLLNKCGEEVPGRLVKLQKDTVDNGIATIKNHWDGERDETIRKNRSAARKEYEGVDLFWDDASGTRDGHLDSRTCFGKMYVKAYPFHIVMVYDDAEDESFIEDSDVLDRFLKKQSEPDIAARRERRRKFRALSAEKCKVHFQFTREEVDHVPDGTHQETYTDSEGKSHTKTVQDYSDVHIMITYTYGVVDVASNYPEKTMATGFVATMSYADGTGDAIKPRTKEPYHVRDRHTTMPAAHMGIVDSWEQTGEMTRLFAADACGPAFEKQMPIFEQSLVDYRQKLVEQEAAANAILGDGFWYFVYNDPTLARDALTAYLQEKEANGILKAIPDNEAAGLDYLYKRMTLVNKDFKSAFWFVFWEDFWLNNCEMSIIKPLADCFDPTQPKAICYHYMERQELERFLNQNDLMRRSAEDSFMSKYCKICIAELFVPSDLDWLYLRLEGKPLPESDEAARKRQANAMLGINQATKATVEE